MSAGAAAFLLGCGGSSPPAGGAPTGGTGGGPTPDAAGTGGAGGSVDSASPTAVDAGGQDLAADRFLESDGLFIAPDGSVIAVDGPGAVPGGPTLACTRRAQQIVGPFPAANVQLDRADIRSDPADGNMVKGGVPLTVVIRVGRRGTLGCAPLAGAVINAWQCDAAGLYSSYASQGTARNQYLRGYQAADASGAVTFQTIYPGSYPGRSVHFHFSVRTSTADAFPGGAFVGQLYFPDEVTDQVLMRPGYSAANRTRNAQDGFYKSDMLGKVTQMSAGWLAELELAV